MSGQMISQGSTLGTTVEVSEIESLSDGNIIIGDGSGAPTTRAAFASSTGAFTPGANGIVSTGNVDLDSDTALLRLGTNQDVILAWAAANVLAMRNGTNAQTFRFYNTFTSDSNHEKAQLQWSGNVFYIGTDTVGGSARPMAFFTNGVERWRLPASTAHLVGDAASVLGWSATDPSAAMDSGITRNAAGVVEVNNGTAGTLRDIKVRSAFATNLGAGHNLRCLRSANLSVAGTFQLVEDTAYWVYLGLTTEALTIKHVEFAVGTGGTGAQTAEIALASTPLAPNKAAQTLTKIAADGTLSDLTGTGVMRNTTTLAASVPAGTHLWAGLRTAMATNEPITSGLSHDWAQGHILVTATASALTGAGPWTGTIVTHALTAQGPNLSAVID